MTRADEAPGRRRPLRGLRPAQHGYVLITVLAALALLAVVAARLDARVAGFWDATDRWGRWHAAERELASARDQLLYAMSTRQLSPLGFGSGEALLRVDGRPYRLPSGTLVSVQDLRGLLSITATDSPVLRGFLRLQGVDERSAERLIDALADYADPDSLRRLHGAEAPEYAAAGLPPPRNEWPLTAYELRSVLGWHERPALLEAAVEQLTGVREGWVNPNTAAPALLQALPGATTEGVQRLLVLREQRHLASAGEVAAASGIVVPDDPVLFYPGQFYRLRLWHPGTPGAAEYTVMLVPGAPVQPWLVLETRRVPVPDWAAHPALALGRRGGLSVPEPFRDQRLPPGETDQNRILRPPTAPADVPPFPQALVDTAAPAAETP